MKLPDQLREYLSNQGGIVIKSEKVFILTKLYTLEDTCENHQNRKRAYIFCTLNNLNTGTA